MIKSKSKYNKVLTIPLIVLVIGLLIPELHWLFAIGLSFLFLFWRLTNVNYVEISSDQFKVRYPFRFWNKGLIFSHDEIERIVFVDRRNATRGTYAHSHFNFYFKNGIKKRVIVMIDTNEIHEIDYLFNNLDVEFSHKDKMDVGFVK